MLSAIETAEERRRRLFLGATLILLIPPIIYFGAEDLLQGRIAQALPVLGLAAFLILQLVLLPRVNGLWWLFRATMVLCIGTLCTEIAAGTSDGMAFLWLYPLPLILFFLFGTREGSFWVAACSLMVPLLFIGPPLSHPYPIGAAIRFAVTFLLVLVLSFRMERSRQLFEKELLLEKSSLEDALEQVHRLSRLMPICASCKNVRDDQGYWSRIEHYVEQHSEAELRPSLCPECMAAGS